jgi:predicted transport protein
LVCIVINKDKLGIYLAMDYEDIDNPRSNVEDVKDKGHWGTGNTVVFISNDEELEYAKELIKDAYLGI